MFNFTKNKKNKLNLKADDFVKVTYKPSKAIIKQHNLYNHSDKYAWCIVGKILDVTDTYMILEIILNSYTGPSKLVPGTVCNIGFDTILYDTDEYDKYYELEDTRTDNYLDNYTYLVELLDK